MRGRSVEIEKGKNDAIYNIPKNLEVGFSKIICACLRKDIMDIIMGQMRAIGMMDVNLEISNVHKFY